MSLSRRQSWFRWIFLMRPRFLRRNSFSFRSQNVWTSFSTSWGSWGLWQEPQGRGGKTSLGWAASLASSTVTHIEAWGKYHWFSSLESHVLAPTLCQTLGWAPGGARQSRHVIYPGVLAAEEDTVRCLLTDCGKEGDLGVRAGKQWVGLSLCQPASQRSCPEGDHALVEHDDPSWRMSRVNQEKRKGMFVHE